MTILLIIVCFIAILLAYAVINVVVELTIIATKKILAHFGIIFCICGRRMTFHETSSRGHANLGYFKCECGLKEPGYKIGNGKPKIYPL